MPKLKNGEVAAVSVFCCCCCCCATASSAPVLLTLATVFLAAGALAADFLTTVFFAGAESPRPNHPALRLRHNKKFKDKGKEEGEDSC